MKKIPVGRTIAHAYGFAFREFFDLLKLMWLALLVTSAAGIALGSSMAAIAAGNLSAIALSWRLIVPIYLVSIVMSLMQMTVVFQYALDQPEAQNRWYYFSLAKPVWRLLGALLAMLLAMLGLAIVYVLAIIAILFLFRLGLGAAHMSDTTVKSILGFDGALAFLIGYCAFLFCAMRFGFLLGVVTIAEGRVGLFRSWTLSHGNFWRMFWITLAIFLPFVCLEFAAMYAGGMLPHFPPPGASVAQIQQLQSEQTARTIAGMARIQHYWYVAYPVFAVLIVLMYGMMAGAQSMAYRILNGTDVTPNPPGPTARSPAPPTQPYQL